MEPALILRSSDRTRLEGEREREREVTIRSTQMVGERRGRAGFDSLSSDFLALVLP